MCCIPAFHSVAENSSSKQNGCCFMHYFPGSAETNHLYVSERLLAVQNPLSQADRPHQLFADAPPSQQNPSSATPSIPLVPPPPPPVSGDMGGAPPPGMPGKMPHMGGCGLGGDLGNIQVS